MCLVLFRQLSRHTDAQAPPMTRRPLCQTGSSWPLSSLGSSSNNRYVVCCPAPDIEEEVVDYQERPWTDSDETEDKL